MISNERLEKLSEIETCWGTTGEMMSIAKELLSLRKTREGWKLVPVAPTENMIVDGFESVPDEMFSEPKVWEEYDAMSGCQQAAHRAKVCWQAMIAAAPEPE